MSELIKVRDKKKSLIADLGLLMVALIWGAGFLVMKDSLSRITPIYLNGIRFILAFFVMMILFWKKMKKVTKQDILGGSIVGVILCAAFVTQTIGLQYTTVSKSAFLTGTNVIMVPFLAWMLYRKYPGWYAMMGAVLAAIGIGLLTIHGSLSIGIGDSLTLVCAFLFAAHIVSVGYFGENMDPYVLATIQIGVTGILGMIGGFLFEPTPEGLGSSIGIAIIYLVFFSTMGALLLQNVAQKYTYSTHAAIILSLESVFGTILGVLVMGDMFTLQMFFGCVLIFFGIIITETHLSFFASKKQKDKKIA
ncbi:DMT family transporter [Clostridiaceae bacterium 35-E11]